MYHIIFTMDIFEIDEIMFTILTNIDYKTYKACFLISKHFNEICESHYLLKILIDKRNNKMKHQYHNNNQESYAYYLTNINKKQSLKERYIYVSTNIFIPLMFWFNKAIES